MILAMNILRSAVLALLAAASGAAFAQIYRWVDQNGKVHITDTPPPPGAKNVQQRRAPAFSESSAQPQPSEPYVLQEARRKAPVTLYSAPGCEPCAPARQLLNARGIPFREVSVVEDKQFEELRKTVGATAVPSLVVGSAVQQGFLESAYHAMLDAGGYPKTGMLPPRAQAEPKGPPPDSETPVTQAEEERPTGPYAPGAPRQGARQRKK
jgi:glutaredoxin